MNKNKKEIEVFKKQLNRILGTIQDIAFASLDENGTPDISPFAVIETLANVFGFNKTEFFAICEEDEDSLLKTIRLCKKTKH